MHRLCCEMLTFHSNAIIIFCVSVCLRFVCEGGALRGVGLGVGGHVEVQCSELLLLYNISDRHAGNFTI